MNKKLKKEEIFLNIAEIIKTGSNCEMLKVGCVITDAEMKNIISIGYNGNYSGGPNYCDQMEVAACGCVHAEISAMIKAKESLVNAVLFSTTEPCLMCSKSIINSGIKRVMFSTEHSYGEGSDIMKKSGISVERIETKND